MSVDSVDIIEAAEDYGENLRLRAERVVNLWRGGLSSGDVVAEFSDAMTHLAASLDPFVRPGCERDEETGEWECGYPDESECAGHHPGADDAD